MNSIELLEAILPYVIRDKGTVAEHCLIPKDLYAAARSLVLKKRAGLPEGDPALSTSRSPTAG